MRCYGADKNVALQIKICAMQNLGNLSATFEGLAYVPEPATLFLLGLGAAMLRRKH